MQGCTSNKKDSVVSHEKSQYHLNSVKAIEINELPLGEAPAEKVTASLNAKDTEKLWNLFINCHGLAFKGMLYTDFVWLLQMDMKKNANIRKIYTNDKGAWEFTKAITQVERDNCIDDISASKFTTILVDGSSDVSVVENEIVYVCTCRNGNGLYYFYHRSPLNISNLKAAFKATGTGLSLVPTRVGGTQWVGHVLLALINVARGYSGIVFHLQ